MFCTKCGSEIKDDARFCTSCGAEVTGASQSVVEAKPVDNAEVKPEVNAEDAPAEVASESVGAAGAGAQIAVPEKAKKKVPRAAVIGVASVAVVILVVAGLFVSGVFASDTKVDEKNFPNGALRQAIVESVDVDGNGSLSQEEKDAVTMFAYNGDAIILGTSSGSVDVEQVQKNLSSKGGSSDASQEGLFESLEVFPNINTVVAPDAGLTEVDMSVFSDAEYIDLRGNSIAELDLSDCSHIRSLFCDPSVSLVGLDAANLYYRDLLTSCKSSYGSGTPQTTTITYDTYGRPIEERDGYGYREAYAYDDAGRLVSRKNATNGYVFETYSYNEDGTLASWDRDNYVESEIETVSLSYDDQGLPISIATSAGVNSSLTYADGVLASAKSVENRGYSTSTSTMDFVFQDGNLTKNTCKYVTESSSTSPWTNDVTVEYSYDANGVLTGVKDSSTPSGGSGSVMDTTLSLSESGFPQKVNIVQDYGSSPMTTYETFECNSDGYITKSYAKYFGSDAGSTTEYGYVKFVSSYDYLDTMRYVPTIRPAVDSAAVGLGALMPNVYFASADIHLGDWGPFAVESFGPQCFNAWLTGIDPQFLENANERAIREKAVELYKQEMGSK